MAPYADQDNIPPPKPVPSYLKPLSRVALGCADDNPGAIDHGCIPCLRGLRVPIFPEGLARKRPFASTRGFPCERERRSRRPGSSWRKEVRRHVCGSGHVAELRTQRERRMMRLSLCAFFVCRLGKRGICVCRYSGNLSLSSWPRGVVPPPPARRASARTWERPGG